MSSSYNKLLALLIFPPYLIQVNILGLSKYFESTCEGSVGHIILKTRTASMEKIGKKRTISLMLVSLNDGLNHMNIGELVKFANLYINI